MIPKEERNNRDSDSDFSDSDSFDSDSESPCQVGNVSGSVDGKTKRRTNNKVLVDGDHYCYEHNGIGLRIQPSSSGNKSYVRYYRQDASGLRKTVSAYDVHFNLVF